MDACRTKNLVSLTLITFYCAMGVAYAQGQTVNSKLSGVTASAAPAPSAAAEAAASTTASFSSSSESKTPSRSFKTGVQKVEFSLEKLREINDDLKRLMKAVNSLNDEVSIQPMSLITQPEVVGGNIINLPVAVQGTGEFMPARKVKVDQAMSSIKPMVADMKANADAFVSNTNQIDLSIPVSAEITPLLKEWIEVVHRLSKEEERLEQLTVGPSYDNQSIARITGFIQADVKKLESNRREMVKTIRKQEKVESKRK
jgi:hypothetical protein